MTDIPRNGLWDWEGRIARLPYFLITLVTSVAGGILTALIDRGASALLFVPLAPIIYINVLALIKRLHDLGLSGWYGLVGLVPLVNFVFTLYLFFAKGHAGVNRYGPPPIDQSNADTPPHLTNSESTAYVAVEPSRHSSANANAPPENAALLMTKSPMPAQETLTIDEDAIYAAIAKELDTGATDKGLWTRLFAVCDGDENKTKVAYIKQRAERIRALEQARIAKIEKLREETAAAEAARLTEEQRAYDLLPKRHCPNCQVIIPLASKVCPTCKGWIGNG